MKVLYGTERRRQKVTVRFLYYTITALLISILQVSVLEFIAVSSITPDLLIILIVWIALIEGRLGILFAGFAYGLIFDLLSNDLIGMNALTKTIVAFAAGLFYKEGKSDMLISTFRFPLIVFLCSLIHNLIYFLFYIQPSDISYLNMMAINGLASSLYTSVFAIFPMFMRVFRNR